ncbi:hypothetical protein DFP92_106171 [Yoonia sediminilitoris]|uniref:Uncharacterized protein n=1 Tax=Yoonia sediminilitoris TaxID=1286148 RepID=A0A2T6KG46_9RHOB|nr:hypothetical protein C8N45_106171 [Yoonia sediminilitoris]RCW95228.1 hypothetical protein DFP92_106171 [Yoonia sediminilitoris]
MTVNADWFVQATTNWQTRGLEMCFWYLRNVKCWEIPRRRSSVRL